MRELYPLFLTDPWQKWKTNMLLEWLVKSELPLFHTLKDNMVCPFNMWALFMKDTPENTWISVVIN